MEPHSMPLFSSLLPRSRLPLLLVLLSKWSRLLRSTTFVAGGWTSSVFFVVLRRPWSPKLVKLGKVSSVLRWPLRGILFDASLASALLTTASSSSVLLSLRAFRSVFLVFYVIQLARLLRASTQRPPQSRAWASVSVLARAFCRLKSSSVFRVAIFIVAYRSTSSVPPRSTSGVLISAAGSVKSALTTPRVFRSCPQKTIIAKIPRAKCIMKEWKCTRAFIAALYRWTSCVFLEVPMPLVLLFGAGQEPHALSHSFLAVVVNRAAVVALCMIPNLGKTNPRQWSLRPAFWRRPSVACSCILYKSCAIAQLQQQTHSCCCITTPKYTNQPTVSTTQTSTASPNSYQFAGFSNDSISPSTSFQRLVRESLCFLLFTELKPYSCHSLNVAHKRELKKGVKESKAELKKKKLALSAAAKKKPLVYDAEALRLTEEAFRVPRLSHTFTSSFAISSSLMNRFQFEKMIRTKTSCGILYNVFEGMKRQATVEKYLSASGKRMLDTPNAGGNSIWSEVLSLEMLASEFGAKLQRTETEIEYDMQCKITDYSISVYGHHIGVSVTRLINFRDLPTKNCKIEFSAEEVNRLLVKKLFGINVSTKFVSDAHKWEKQILHVLTTSESAAREVYAQYCMMDKELRANSIVLVSCCKNFEWLF